MQKKDIILFVNSIQSPTYSALETYAQKTGMQLRPMVLVDKQIRDSIHSLNSQHHLKDNAIILTADFDSPTSIRKALQPYQDRMIACVTQYENSIPEYKKLIPYLPYLPAPTETSLDWSTDKKLMRRAFNAYDPSLSPVSVHAHDASRKTIDAIEEQASYPMIIKPSGLERSLLVSVVHNRQELTTKLAATFEKLDKAYQTWMKRLTPTILVEEFMEGDMYSVDTYVAADGRCRHAPVVEVVTGRKVGFEDFFAYLQMTPAGLTAKETKAAYTLAEHACKALGLRSITAHTEMMRTPHGWKIIEVGPRIGGYRHELYSLSHGMSHIMNDVLNRTGKIPVIPEKPNRHAAIYKTYGREEGILASISGIDSIEKLPSYVTKKCPFKPGDEIRFAHNNGDAVIEITLCHESPLQLHTDIETIERTLKIKVQRPSTRNKKPTPVAHTIPQ